MDLLNFKKEDFKNPAAFEILEVLTGHVNIFLTRKKANEFRGILMAVGAAFPEDRATIYKTLGDPAAQRKANRPTGGAKIQRRKANQAAKSVGNCEGCLPIGTAIHSGAKPGEQAGKSFELRQKAVKLGGLRRYATWQELEKAFESNATAMRAFAVDKGIKIAGNIRRADTMAKALFNQVERLTNASPEEEE